MASTPPAPHARPRWPLFAGAGGALALVVVLMAVLASGGGSSKGRTPGATTGAFPSANEKALLSHVPTELRGLCKREEPSQRARAATAGVQCTPATLASSVTYEKYSTSGERDQAYEQLRSPLSIQRNTQKDCHQDTDSEGAYETKSGSGGRMLCYLAGGLAHLIWTVNDRPILGRAERGEEDRYSVYLWWANAVGRRLADFPNANEKVLLSHIPADMRDRCVRGSVYPDALAAIDCAPADVDAVLYNLMRDKDAMASEYENALKTYSIARSSGRSGVCPQESSYDTKGVPNGRHYCTVHSEGPNDVSTGWTNDALTILTFAYRQGGDVPKLLKWWNEFEFS
jgi:hypothetical protein